MKKFLLCGFAFLMACNTHNNVDQHVIRLNPDSNPMSNPKDMFSSMKVISLKCPDDIVLQGESDVIYNQNKFFIVDAMHGKRADIFNSDGEYFSSVASHGRSGNEYIGIDAVQVVDSMVAIYSYHNKAVFYYTIDGNFVRKDPIEFTPRTLVRVEDGYLGYTGFGNGQMPERVVKMDPEGKIVGKYLPSDAAVIGMTEKNAVFSKYQGSVLVRESFRNEILSLDKKGQEQLFLKFDFGKYNVPDKYFEYSDPFAAADMLLKSDFAIMDSFFLDENYSVLSVIFQMGNTGGERVAALGVARNSAWKWLKSGPKGPMSMFFMTARQLIPDSTLLLLATGEQIKEFSKKYPELIAEFDYSSENPYIVLCNLK